MRLGARVIRVLTDRRRSFPGAMQNATVVDDYDNFRISISSKGLFAVFLRSRWRWDLSSNKSSPRKGLINRRLQVVRLERSAVLYIKHCFPPNDDNAWRRSLICRNVPTRRAFRNRFTLYKGWRSKTCNFLFPHYLAEWEVMEKSF